MFRRHTQSSLSEGAIEQIEASVSCKKSFDFHDNMNVFGGFRFVI